MSDDNITQLDTTKSITDTLRDVGLVDNNIHRMRNVMSDCHSALSMMDNQQLKQLATTDIGSALLYVAQIWGTYNEFLRSDFDVYIKQR
jgi:hypothetical protein